MLMVFILNKNNLTVIDNDIAEKYGKYLLKLLFILKKQYVTLFYQFCKNCGFTGGHDCEEFVRLRSANN